MSDFDSKKDLFEEEMPIVFGLDDVVSSGEMIKNVEVSAAVALDAAEDVSPVFKELASVELPELPKENRARLQMQTPNRLFFYWSMKSNPFQTLRRAFGTPDSYTLVARLVDLKRNVEAIYPIEAEGTWWFNVDSDSRYQAEIGFYAPNRPYVRVMFSNTIDTPRKRPSSRVATSADWKISARVFAEVLDISGFKQDAFEVALAGDRPQEIQAETHRAFAKFVEGNDSDFAGIASDELRYALMLIASGLQIEHLRYRIDASLFALLEASVAKLSAERAAAALKEHFDINAEDIYEHEETGEQVIGASLVNFPRRLKRKRSVSGYNPVSSFR
ncbi:MAG: DUF4912 domain-containing protein [Acidobacteriota bacterium]